MQYFKCSDVELECMEEVGYYSTSPYLMHSSDKVLLNPYTQNPVLSIESCQSNVVPSQRLVLNG